MTPPPPGRGGLGLRIGVTGGLDGAMRVLSTLRGRGYRVRGLSLHVDEAGDASVLDCVVATSPSEVGLLLERLRRLPAVLGAAET